MVMQRANWGDPFQRNRDGEVIADQRPDWVREVADMDLRAILDIAAAGDALFQEVVNRVIQVCHKRIIGAITVFEFRPGSGDAHHLNRQTPGPDGEWVDDTDLLGSDDVLTNANAGTASYVKTSFEYKFMLVQGTVTRHVIARGRDFTDVFANELAHAVERAMYTLELTTFQGNFGGAATKEFDGLFELVGVYNGTLAGQPTQVFTPDTATGDATPANSVSGNLTLNLLDKMADEMKPGPKVWLVSKVGSRLINGLLVAQREYNPGDRITIAGGFRVNTYDDHPIVKTDGINDDMAWGLDGSGNPQLTALSGATGTARTTAILCVNTDDVWYDELTPLTVEPYQPPTSQRRDFEAYWDGVLVLGCPEGATMSIGILPNA